LSTATTIARLPALLPTQPSAFTPHHKNYWNYACLVYFAGSDLIMWMMKNLDVDDQSEYQLASFEFFGALL